jgi:uncharacterized membrane protein
MNKKLFQYIFILLKLGFPRVKVSAGWPLAQAVHESANFTSNLAVTANNLFGMNYPSVRKTCAISKDANGYAMYRSKLDSIRDYLMWLDQLDILDDQRLVAKIKGNYATDKKYYDKVARVYNGEISELVQPSSLLLGGVAAAVAGTAAVIVLNTLTK